MYELIDTVIALWTINVEALKDMIVFNIENYNSTATNA